MKRGAQAVKAFYDRLAQYVIRFGARLMVGDWNMQLFAVIPEMRARGFEISLAAWYPFHLHNESFNRSDSCAIFTVGPWTGVRIVFDQAVFGMTPREREVKNSLVLEILKDESGKEISKQRYDVRDMGEKGQGYPLSSYMPNCKATKAKFIDMTFDIQVSIDKQQHYATVSQANTPTLR